VPELHLILVDIFTAPPVWGAIDEGNIRIAVQALAGPLSLVEMVSVLSVGSIDGVHRNNWDGFFFRDATGGGKDTTSIERGEETRSYGSPCMRCVYGAVVIL
jgi:hypothetical protein